MMDTVLANLLLQHLSQRTSANTPSESMQHCQVSTPDSYTMAYHEKRPACLPSSGRAWSNSMFISTGSTQLHRTNTPADKQERQWNTSCSDVRSGHGKEPSCSNAPIHAEASFYLGGKSPSDDKNRAPNMEAVRTTIRFTIATGRLDADQPQGGTP